MKLCKEKSYDRYMSLIHKMQSIDHQELVGTAKKSWNILIIKKSINKYIIMCIIFLSLCVFIFIIKN